MRQTLRIASICMASWVQLAGQPSPEWASSGSLREGRYYHQAVLLANGKVLVTGGQAGCVAGNPCRRVNSAELYDPSTDAWEPTGEMLSPRSNHFAVRLPGGKVLAGGGFSTGALNSAELYDPATGTWSGTGDMNMGRANATATLLRNGKVLVAGGTPSTHPYAGLGTAELYDPASGSWAPTGAMNTTRTVHTATLLPDGRVLVAGGGDYLDGIATRSSAEIYDPATGTWTATGSLQSSRAYHTANLLPNGRVLVAGGSTLQASSFADSAELYDPATGLWTNTGRPGSARVSHTATSLPDGGVLLVAGSRDTSGNPAKPSVEIYDPAAGTWRAAPEMKIARWSHAATLLVSGKVMVTGGNSPGLPGMRIAETLDSGVSSVTTASSASPAQGGFVAVDSIASAYGVDLAGETQVAASPLAPALADVSVNIKDQDGVAYPATLFAVTPNQVNFLVPAGVTTGAATVVVVRGEKAIAMGPVAISRVAPGLFTANGGGDGVAAASVLRVKADGSRSVEAVAIYDAAQGGFTATPIDFGVATDQLFLILYGTGIRHAGQVKSSVGRVEAEVMFAGGSPEFAGLDQVVLRLPRSLSGRGPADVEVTADSQKANVVQVSFR